MWLQNVSTCLNLIDECTFQEVNDDLSKDTVNSAMGTVPETSCIYGWYGLKLPSNDILSKIDHQCYVNSLRIVVVK